MDVFSGKSFIKSFKGVIKISYREMSAELSLDMSLRISSDMLLRIRFRSFPRIPSETSLGITLEILLGCPLINPSEGIRSFSRVSSIIFLTDTEVSYFFINRCSALSEVIFKDCFRKYYSQQRFFSECLSVVSSGIRTGIFFTNASIDFLGFFFQGLH